MSKKTKKAMSMLLVVALIAVIAIGGMLAYLTDRDSEANVFTVGDVAIDLTEEFDQGATLTPGVDIEKEVKVVNTGKNDAWVWVEIAIPKALDGGQDASKNVIHFNYPKDAVGSADNQWTWLKNESGYVIGSTVKNEIEYNIYTVMYNSALAANETTAVAAMNNVYMDTHVDIDPNGNWAWVNAGVATNLGWNSNKEGNPIIYVSAYAMQEEEFATVADAYAAYQTQWGNNGAEYADPAEIISVKTDAEFEEAVAKNDENIVISLENDVTYSVEAWANKAMGGTDTKDIVIYGNGHTLNFNQTNSDWNNVVTNGAELSLVDMDITNSGHNNGPWNRHDINFNCEVKLTDVTSDKALAFKAGANLKNVKISDANTSDTYAIWIQPNGQTVTLDGCTIDMLACTDGRGIKIDEQYVGTPEKVTLNVSNTVFKTEEKSAILVKSAAGADITLKNVDISGVVADSVNHVWVDEASEAYADLVVVTGGTKIVEL